MPAGLPTPNRKEFGPREMSTRLMSKESHGISLGK